MSELTHDIKKMEKWHLNLQIVENDDADYAFKQHDMPYCNYHMIIHPLKYPYVGYKIDCGRRFKISVNQLTDFLFTLYYTNLVEQKGMMRMVQL